MKAKLKFDKDRKKQIFCIIYENDEWVKIEKKLKELGLEKGKTSMLWGKNNLSCEFYRESDHELLSAFLESFKTKIEDLNITLIDNINRPFCKYRTFNIAIFRIIPTNNVVEVELDDLLTIDQFNGICRVIVKLYEFIFSIAMEIEVNIRIKNVKVEEEVKQLCAK